MTFQVGILDALHWRGLTVREVNGWRTRGRPEADAPFDPFGSVNHHTAGAPTGIAPSLGVITDGRSDLAGPLANVLQSRERDANGLDVVYLVSAGRCNHAGEGVWKDVSGNAHFWGLEIEHVGTTDEPFGSGRVETAARVHAAFASLSRFPAGMVCQHYEYATPPGRKSDFLRAELDPQVFRNRIATILAGGQAPTEDEMFEARAVTVPAADDQGRQLCARSMDGALLGAFRHDVVATIKANDDGHPVHATVQVCEYKGLLVLSFLGTNGGPVPEGNVEVILNHPAR